MDELKALIELEADLLDRGDLLEWVELYAEEATYWVPIDEHADPEVDSSIIYDNRQRLVMRVDQIVHQNRVAQQPASETWRMISNLKLSEEGGRLRARYKMLLAEARRGDWRQNGLDETRLYPAWVELEAAPKDGQLRIVSKKIVLLGRHRPFTGLSFII
ncbi:aromatic-ring-hydroxylating dioxygenase subunit beta [Alkalilimnicola sp. S0819]|uniref:aromatic-ring-hydroxylating dioxygenase subunit beta n=1 Tax=Alkalilimnicola sp. S0819 TaxID=2613922 RepID=UPI0012615B50|nr:aromatic-ring-hydroxylating dioxygenase subunit beta [Alkalilimnicola sp. S0819]KAB7624083.1 hypothetical protein F3N43_06750 [Alkalilimnicola sp. S0819]MPQ16333.1 hypothetical protein [Alkalilimnicola sp. S0819]